MKFYQASHTFQHPWSTVTQAFWRKYPNDYQSVVYGTDVLERFVDSEGKLHSKRIIISDWNLPSFMKFFFGDTRGYAVEYSIVDPVKETLTLRSRNINAESMFTMQEEIVYRSAGERTNVNHEAKILISVSQYFDERAEDYIVETITEAACKGLKAIDSMITALTTEDTDSCEQQSGSFDPTQTTDTNKDNKSENPDTPKVAKFELRGFESLISSDIDSAYLLETLLKGDFSLFYPNSIKFGRDDFYSNRISRGLLVIFKSSNCHICNGQVAFCDFHSTDILCCQCHNCRLAT